MRYGQKTITFRTRSLWSKLPKEYKLSKSPKSFKKKLKTGKEMQNFPCSFCQTFQKDLGFK